MSWAEEDWTVGLSGRVLQKVKELQVHHERLSRENKQKQLQLDNIQTSLEKQNVKYEEVRGELHSAQRELQSVREEVKAAVTSKDRLTQDLQTKQAQICSFEGQLDAARTLNNKLTQEIKRLEAELEKLQNSSRSADTSLYSTPCWNTSSPWEHNGSRKEERQGHRDEGQSRAFHSRQRLQFSEVATSSLPRQQHRNTPHSHSSDQLDSYSTPLAAFPWERDDTRPASKRRSPPSPQTPCDDVNSQGHAEQGVWGMKDQRTETDQSLSEMRSRVSTLEEELKEKAGTLKSIQNEMVLNQKELAAKELSIQKTRNELSLAHTRMAQESERASAAEQRQKQLQEELKCQRQNAESSRLQHQQRLKELEKQHQRDLTELQKERQSLEKQHQQEVNKLNHELQQARTLHNALQAQADKLSLQKQELDKELGTLKEKLKWTEGQLQDSQKKEAQTQAKLTEAVREAEGVAVSLEQSRKRERALEEEGRRLTEERADALRLLKELEEQKAASAPPLQPVQFCSQSSYAPHPRPSTHIKRQPTAFSAEQKREEENDFGKRRAEITASYPPDREPGEGIDSEHISQVPECVEGGVHRRKSNEEENNIRHVVVECDSSGMNKLSTFDNALCSSSQSTAGTPANLSIDADSCSLKVSTEKTSSLQSEQGKASADLKRENASLRSELQDAREELQKRLEDLEAQRRAEAEARTRLKQLSRKHASQAVEKEEQDKEWRAQLESERAETDRLRKAMAALEMEGKKERNKREVVEREKQEEEKNRIQEDRESEMIELNIQLKKQLSEVKGQLALEREERKREEEERNQKTNKDMDMKKELSMKLEELQAELEEIKRCRKEDSLEGEELANNPLTYLTLHDDELNSNTVHCDNKLLPSPEQHLLFCQSTNQRNMFVSQGTGDLIQEEGAVLESGDSPLSDKSQTDQVPSVLEDTKQNYEGGDSLSEPAPSHLREELERLRKETAKEAERANQYQVKLEALQNQVTHQTQQLTMAFERQSQHISGLLGELQEKESTLLSQGEELQRCKQELDELKAQKGEEITAKEKNGKQKEETQDEGCVEVSGLQPNLEKECALTSPVADSLTETDSNAQRDTRQQETVISDIERPTPKWNELDNEAGEQNSTSGHLDKTPSNPSSAGVMEEAEGSQDGGAAEVLALREENQLLKQRLEGLTALEKTNPGILINSENQKDPVKQNQTTGNASSSCLAEQKSLDVLNVIPTEARQSPLQSEKGSDENTEEGAEELEEASELQIDHLQQQVVELHMKLRALSEQTKQQAEELAVWRLASQPAPTFVQLCPDTENQSESQDLISVVGQAQSNQQQIDKIQIQAENQVQGSEESPGILTIIREDEILLSSSSNKLQGRMLFSRLQQRNLPEPKSLHHYRKTAAFQEYNRDTAKIDEESEKENMEINLLPQSYICQTQLKERRDTEVLQMPSEKTGQQNVTKDSHSISGSKQIKTAECYMESLEAKPDTCRATNEENTNTDSSGRDLRTEMISVSCQTEESLSPQSPQTASELQSVYTQTEEEEEDDEGELVESPPVSPIPLSEGAEAGEKMLFSGSFPIPADPARLAERIRRNRTQLSAAFDDTEYEPYGLPEVVMKGFADIPTGPSCPYIVRRGLLGTTVVPAPKKDSGKEEEETD